MSRVKKLESEVARLRRLLAETDVVHGFCRGALTLIANPDKPRLPGLTDQQIAADALAFRFELPPKA